MKINPYSLNIPFKAHIQLCTNQELHKIAKQSQSIVDSNEDYVKGRNIGTQGVIMCNAGGLTGSDEYNNLLFHLYDGLDKPEKYITELHNEIKNAKNKIKKDGESELQALILGASKDFEDSEDFAIIIDYIFNLHNLDYSAFIGAKEDKHMFFDADKGGKGTWYINLQRDFWDRKGNRKKKSVFGKRNIMQSFSYIKMSPNDTINFHKESENKPNYKNIQKREIDSSRSNVIRIFNKYNIDLSILEEIEKDAKKLEKIV